MLTQCESFANLMGRCRECKFPPPKLLITRRVVLWILSKGLTRLWEHPGVPRSLSPDHSPQIPIPVSWIPTQILLSPQVRDPNLHGVPGSQSPDPKKSARARKMTPRALPKRLLRHILRILGPFSEFWVAPGGRGQRRRVTIAGTVIAAIPQKSMVSLRRERNSRKAACQTPVTSTSKTSLLVDL